MLLERNRSVVCVASVNTRALSKSIYASVSDNIGFNISVGIAREYPECCDEAAGSKMLDREAKTEEERRRKQDGDTRATIHLIFPSK